jgi:hypothetical protein
MPVRLRTAVDWRQSRFSWAIDSCWGCRLGLGCAAALAFMPSAVCKFKEVQWLCKSDMTSKEVTSLGTGLAVGLELWNVCGVYGYS